MQQGSSGDVTGTGSVVGWGVWQWQVRQPQSAQGLSHRHHSSSCCQGPFPAGLGAPNPAVGHIPLWPCPQLLVASWMEWPNISQPSRQTSVTSAKGVSESRNSLSFSPQTSSRWGRGVGFHKYKLTAEDL